MPRFHATSPGRTVKEVQVVQTDGAIKATKDIEPVRNVGPGCSMILPRGRRRASRADRLPRVSLPGSKRSSFFSFCSANTWA